VDTRRGSVRGFGGGRYSDQQRRGLATALDELSAALRESTDAAAPTAIEVEQ